MHELFTQVLSNKDLSKAGDLFSVPDSSIINDLTEVLTKISEITSLPDYVNNTNDQSVVEICITRVTSAIRETDSIEQHAEALVGLLECCLNHNLKPSPKDEDPPHAKISSDIISCIFLNYNKKDVMKRALPVAVKLLHKGNRELSRNMASYLSLAVIHNAPLLSQHIQLIIDSVISGNYPLCRVLPQIYAVTKDPIHEHAMALVSLLPQCELSEKLALLQLFALVAHNKPLLLEASLPQLVEYLGTNSTILATMQIFLHLAEKRPQLLVDYVPKLKQANEGNANTLCITVQVVAAVGRLSKDKAQDALNFILSHLPKADRSSQSILLREATLLCSTYPVLCTDKMLAEVWQCSRNSAQVNQSSNNNGVTIVTVGGCEPATPGSSNLKASTSVESTNNIPASEKGGSGGGGGGIYKTKNSTTVISTHSGHSKHQDSNSRIRSRIGADSRSTSRLNSSAAHRSMTRLNIASSSRLGSVGGLHKSMTRLSTSSHINQPPAPAPQPQQTQSHQPHNRSVTSIHGTRHYNVAASKVTSGGVTVTTSTRSPSPTKTLTSSGGLRDDSVIIYPRYTQFTPRPVSTLGGSSPLNPSSAANLHVAGAVSTRHINTSTVTPRRQYSANNNTSVTIINSNNNMPSANNSAIAAASQRISVFEPYPMRDTIQHFCEKHLDKIKSYMEKVSVRIPSPAKCTIEERRAKKMAKLHFACQGRGEHCLYSRALFTTRTRHPRAWIHLMFLSLQARSDSALSSRDSSVSSLKHCWDILKCENKTFLTLVTSAFPCAKVLFLLPPSFLSPP
uniref:Protein melted n=1 Tax=Cacopsylla melanoneura TaxID=428564 RepID=A0A8D8YKJ2_9HEMI